MDVISDVLQVVRLSGAVFFRAEFSSPWALESPNAEVLPSIVLPQAECVSLFHIVVDGECVVECAAHPPATMLAGDVILLPQGDSHTMRSRDAELSIPLGQVFPPGEHDAPPHVSFGGGGSKSRLICGYLDWDQRFSPLMSVLPTMLVVRRRDAYGAVVGVDRHGGRPARVPPESGSWLATTLRYAVTEAQAARPGNGAMLRRLTELMFVEIVREYMHQLAVGERDWLVSLQDPHVGEALRRLHSEPAREWTVQSLARQVALSRSALAERFVELVGETPMKYLAAYRIHLAKQLLREGEASVQAVAVRVGYESESAFSRAFKRSTGCPPGAWRRADFLTET